MLCVRARSEWPDGADLVFNTLFVPSLTFASIDALLYYLQHEGRVLSTMGEMFLHNSGTFFLNYGAC